jgi:hypothetical protein
MELVRPILRLGCSVLIAFGVLSSPALATQSAASTAAPSATPSADPLSVAAPQGTNPSSFRKTVELEKKRVPRFQLDIDTIKPYALGADQLVLPGEPGDNQLIFGGHVYFNITPRLRAYEVRDNHFDVVGRTFKKGKPNYSGQSWDLQYDTGLRYEITRSLSISEDYVYRYRVCCPNAADATNSTPRIKQGPRTTLEAWFGPVTRIGQVLMIKDEATYVIHHYDLGEGLPAGTPVLGNTWINNIEAYAYIPILGQRQVVPFFGVEHYTDFFDNDRVPTMTNRTQAGLIIRGTRFVSYRFYVKNEHQTNPGGDVSHKVMLYLESSFKFQ